MENKNNIALLIVNHLKNELKSGNFNEENMESLEVAVQCIESAYGLNATESDELSIKLENIIRQFFENGGLLYANLFAASAPPLGDSAPSLEDPAPSLGDSAPSLGDSAPSLEAQSQVKETAQEKLGNEISEDQKEEAEYHKNCGNEFMKNQNNEKAIEAYSKSIRLNPYNPIFYCNRAAAYNALGHYNDAIIDCEKAIELDSTYGKAYCRLGLAFSYLKDYHKAVTCYKKACDLDPGNIGYQRNYQLTLSNLQGGLPDLQNGTANIMETAARLMNNPEVSSVLNNILGENSNPGTNSGLDRLMQVGQTIVTRLQTSDPHLLDGIRMHFESAQDQQSPQSPPPNNGFTDDDDIQP